MENTNDLRKAMGCFATGVAIITTSDEQFEPIGVTINSFTSLSIHLLDKTTLKPNWDMHYDGYDIK